MPETGASAPFTRRNLVRTAAWVTPAIIVAAAAPAQAASAVHAVNPAKPPAQLIVYTFQPDVVWDNNGHKTKVSTVFKVDLAYVANAQSVQTIVTTIAFPTNVVKNKAPVNTLGAGWSYIGQTSSASADTFTFTWTGALTGTSATPPVTFVVELAPQASGSKQIGLTAQSPTATSTAGTRSVQL
ncbi:hypothetical protein WDJ51_08975 [Rathayibacter sp. YIM 133350]|uniref:hypothetical protein n=1 Tax=Rathayibacter sp. YIM 133350 TaxID=3131992 RepID=UPI00307E385D